MNYQALLFCPDEKTARVVTQVLTELEFSVELSNEPFATVKKLMAKQYDAVVVDCDNEQNATLLFKSARNSTSNQTSLAVAVVEGQAGVAKAFRIGANLVLTKPVNVEQSKGTLRVARGLLKKAEAGKPASGKPSAPPPTAAPSPLSNSYPGKMPLSAARAASSTSAAKFAATLSANPPVLAADASMTSFEIDQDPTPALEATETAFLQSIPKPASSKTSTPGPGSPSNGSPWLQLSRPAVKSSEATKAPEPEATPAYTGTAENITPLAAPTRVRHPFNTGLSSAQAAAAAPAREVDLPQPRNEPFADKALADLAALSAPPQAATDAPGRTRKSLLAALLVIAMAAAGYLERDKLLALVEPASGVSAPTPPQIAPPPSAPIDATTPATQPAATQPQSSEPLPQLNQNQSSESQPTPSSSNNKAPADEIVVVENSAAEHTPDIKLPAKKIPAHLEKPEPAPVQQSIAPPSLHPSSDSQDQTIAHLITTAPLTVPHRAPELLRVSQGITQGMLVKKVKPIYPSAALQQHREGTVEIAANIAKNGSISSARVIKGDPLLAQAALTAVKQWKYKPYTLDGQAVDVQTQISINFKLP